MAVKRSRAAFLCVRRCFSVESKLGRTPYSELQLINNFVSADEERDIIQNLSTVFKRKRYVGLCYLLALSYLAIIYTVIIRISF